MQVIKSKFKTTDFNLKTFKVLHFMIILCLQQLSILSYGLKETEYFLFFIHKYVIQSLFINITFVLYMIIRSFNIFF